MSATKSDTASADEVSPDEQPVAETTDRKGGELFIVDNSETEWKGLRYLQDWTEIASAFDIATGFFEIGALLASIRAGKNWTRFASCLGTK